MDEYCFCKVCGVVLTDHNQSCKANLCKPCYNDYMRWYRHRRYRTDAEYNEACKEAARLDYAKHKEERDAVKQDYRDKHRKQYNEYMRKHRREYYENWGKKHR